MYTYYVYVYIYIYVYVNSPTQPKKVVAPRVRFWQGAASPQSRNVPRDYNGQPQQLVYINKDKSTSGNFPRSNLRRPGQFIYVVRIRIYIRI